MQKSQLISSLLPSQSNSTQSPKKKQPLTKQSFQIISKLGRGAYGHVYLVKKDNILYAMKQIQKRKLSKQHKQYQALIEKQILTKIKHPGVVKLIYSFQDKQILYFIMEYCEGGCFREFIKLNYAKLTLELKLFYIAEIVNILEYLHQHGITHRDLKPQNLMLSKSGHLKLIDFGTAQITRCDLISEEFKQKIDQQKKSKQNQNETKQPMVTLLLQRCESQSQLNTPRKRQRRSTFVGTCYYISPQLLQQNICQAPSDLWALGCIIYQMFYLQTPFKDAFQYQVFEKIKSAKVQYPKIETINEDVIDLIKRLLIKNPYQRLGCNSRPQLSYTKLKQHPCFKGIDFTTIFTHSIPEMKQDSLKQEQIVQHTQKIQRSASQMQVALKKQIEDGKQKILIHGILEKKTFITYNLYYFIVYKNLQVKRIKCQQPQKVKNMKIKYKNGWSKNKKGANSNTKESNSSSLQNKEINLAAYIISSNKFDLCTDEKLYTLKAKDNLQALRWVETINKQVQNLKSKWLSQSSQSSKQ